MIDYTVEEIASGGMWEIVFSMKNLDTAIRTARSIRDYDLERGQLSSYRVRSHKKSPQGFRITSIVWCHNIANAKNLVPCVRVCSRQVKLDKFSLI